MPVVLAHRFVAAHHRTRVTAACACAVLTFATTVKADDEPRVSVAGFGTLGALYHTEQGIEYRRDPSQGRGAQAGTLDFGTDSRLGLQLNAPLSASLEVMVQAETKLTSDNDWTPEINWAVLKYAPTDWLTLSVGRLNFDPFVGGNSRDIGYAWLTARPPIEVFGSMNSQRFDGGEVVLSAAIGEGLLETKVYGGEMTGGEAVVAPSFRIEFDGSELIGGHIEYSTALWSTRIGVSHGTIESKNPSADLISALRSIGTRQSFESAKALNIEGRHVTEAALSATYRPGPLQAELIVSHARSEKAALPLGDRAAAIVGYRFHELTPYAAFGIASTERTLYVTGISSSSSPQAAGLNDAVERIQRGAWANQRSWGLGVRYDAREKLAIKAQVDVVDLDDASVVLETDASAGRERTFPVFSLAVDFIF